MPDDDDDSVAALVAKAERSYAQFEESNRMGNERVALDALQAFIWVITGDIPRHPGNVRLQHSGEHQRDDPQASVLSHKYQHLLQLATDKQPTLELLKKSVNGHPTPVDFDYDLDVDVDAGDYCDDDGAKDQHVPSLLNGSAKSVSMDYFDPLYGHSQPAKVPVHRPTPSPPQPPNGVLIDIGDSQPSSYQPQRPPHPVSFPSPPSYAPPQTPNGLLVDTGEGPSPKPLPARQQQRQQQQAQIGTGLSEFFDERPTAPKAAPPANSKIRRPHEEVQVPKGVNRSYTDVFKGPRSESMTQHTLPTYLQQSGPYTPDAQFGNLNRLPNTTTTTAPLKSTPLLPQTRPLQQPQQLMSLPMPLPSLSSSPSPSPSPYQQPSQMSQHQQPQTRPRAQLQPRPHAQQQSQTPVNSQLTLRNGIAGFRNLGNTCYMNSTLQCLSVTRILTRHFLDGSFTKSINQTNPLGTGGVVVRKYAELLAEVWHSQQAVLSPYAFKSAISQFASQFKGDQQQDAQEFLAFLLDGMHEDLNMVRIKPTVTDPDSDGSNYRDEDLATISWNNYLKRNNSIIVDLFQGQYRSVVTCLACNKKSVTFNTFMYLSVPVPAGQSQVTLNACIDRFCDLETLTEKDGWFCSRCNTQRRATKQLKLWRLPDYLIIHLKRFAFDGPWRNKITTNVQFPHDLHLTAAKSVDTFKVYGVTNHFGTLTGGHYTAFCQNNHDGKWHNFDDSRVTQIPEHAVQSPAAYILFYAKVSPRAFL